MSEGDDRSRRPGRRHQTSTERDLEGLQARQRRQLLPSPPVGVAAVPSLDEWDQLTPVTDLLAECTANPGHELEVVLRHVRNRELRFVEAIKERSAERLLARVAKTEESLIDIHGSSGKNGKLGALKDRVDKAESRRWWLITFLATLLVTVVSTAVVFGRWMGSIETQVDTLKNRSHRYRPAPAEMPEKDLAP